MFLLDKVSFSYDSEHGLPLALNKVSLHIRAGEWWALLGANGSGKSTLARHLNALLFPAAGSLYVDGLDTLDEENLQNIRRRVGIVFQNPDNQIIGNTVEEDIAFGPENLGLPSERIRELITTCLAQVGLSGFEQKDPNKLSGGQKQRVAIAGALAMQPQALILDEATSMLDPEGAREVFGVLKALHRSGMTIVMITHNMSEAAYADKAAVLRRGELMTVGRPEEIFSQKEDMKGWGLELPPSMQLAERLLSLGVGKYLPGGREDLAFCPELEDLVQAINGAKK